MSAPPTDNGEGEQAYSDITLMSLVLHKEACKMCKFIMRQEFLDRDISWELDKQGKRQYSFDWLCLHQGTVNEASSLFTNIFY